jgi:hypothetical protein
LRERDDFAEDLRADPRPELREDLPPDFREDPPDDLRLGTFAPFSRASLRPIAIACFRLFTLPPEPLLSVPCFLRRIADSTFLDADLPYFAMGFNLVSACCRRLTCKRRAEGHGIDDRG